MREFELNTLQKGRRLWDEKYLKKTKSVLKKDRKVSKFNHYLGNLFFSQEGQFDSLNIFYHQNLETPLFDIREFPNHQKSLTNVKKLSLGFFYSNIHFFPIITEIFLYLQNTLSPNIQHLQIFIKTRKEHSVLNGNLFDLIQSQQYLETLMMNFFWDPNEIKPFIDSLQNSSRSLTFLRLEHDQELNLPTELLLSIFNSFPNLITFELFITSLSISDDGNDSVIPETIFNNLEHLCITQSLGFLHLFKRIIPLTKKLKSFKVDDNFVSWGRFLWNLTHFHLVMKYTRRKDLIDLSKNLPNVVHLKLNATKDWLELRGDMLKHLDLFEELSQSLARSLEILEINFTIVDKCLEILQNNFIVKICSDDEINDPFYRKFYIMIFFFNQDLKVKN